MLIPRVKTLILVMSTLFVQDVSGGASTGNPWLQFGQLGAIVYISYLVIKRGSKAGDQDVSFWDAKFTRLEDEISKLRDEVIKSNSSGQSNSKHERSGHKS